MARNIRNKLNKLQLALIQRGIVTRVNTKQVFFDDTKRICTQYSIYCEKGKEKLKLETFRLSDAVLFLSKVLSGDA